MFTKNFSQLSRVDVNTAGGKGAFLGELTRNGAEVPPGFVILTNAYDHFLKSNTLEKHVNHLLDSLQKPDSDPDGISHELQTLFIQNPLPGDLADEIKKQNRILGAELVAVRSSATAEDNADRSWAGQLETYLNVTAANLPESVKKCWASLFSRRAIAYLMNETVSSEPIKVAVVVQKMINPLISGVAFSVNPVSENPNEMIIEAAYGLGEAIVQGELTPDHYLIDKASCKPIDIFLSEQKQGIYKLPDGSTGWKNLDYEYQNRQKLDENEIMTLARKVLTIERTADFPSDIEWAYFEGTFYFLQCRPITTLNTENQ